jgi:sarcosine oxidase
MIDTEVIVVGLGAMGSATCRALAARSIPVVGIDRHRPPHVHGSSHGDTRITRLITAEGPQYAPLAIRSQALWRELEAQTGQALLHQVGTLMISRPGSPFLATVERIAREMDLAHELLDAAALRSRYPMFAAGEDAAALLDHGGGWVSPEVAVDAQLQVAARDGAQLLLDTTVTEWSASTDGVTVRAGDETVHGDRLVLCAGPWLPQLLGPGELAARFAVRRQLLFWFDIARGYEALAKLPTWVWDVEPADPNAEVSAAHARGFYGFPAIDGPDGGLKLATEQAEREHVPDDRQHPATPAQVAEMYDKLVRDRLPWLSHRALRTVSCLYTCTADGHFVIDRHPEHPAVTVVSPCSGHGFKHSAAIGEAVAQTVCGETPTVDLSPFALAPDAV